MTKPINVLLSDDLYERLRESAVDNERSVAGETRYALAYYLTREDNRRLAPATLANLEVPSE